MMITLNGEALAVEAVEAVETVTIAELLELRLDDPRPHGVAVAVNEEVVPRAAWPEWRLADGDAVEIVTAVQGG